MKDSLFIKICLIVIIGLLGLNLLFQNRYEMYVVSASPEDTYKSDYVIKLDRWTGRIWYLATLGPGAGKIVELGQEEIKIPQKP
jgi:hypothetical protein